MAKLLSTLPVGTKVKDANTKYYGKPIIFQVLDKNHPGYPANSVTLLTERMITLKSFDAMEPANSDASRRSYGNNRYAHSNIRQWLNKDSSPWYAAQHGADQAPSAANVWTGHNPYDQEAGFLANFSTDLKAKLLTTTLTVAKNTVTDGGGSETVQDKVFLLSNTEVGLANENSIAEGSVFPGFTSDAARVAYPTAEAVVNSSYTNASLNANSGWYWWLRTPNAGYSYSSRSVYSSGSLNNYSAYYGYYGVRPALNLPSEIFVSDAPDTDGAYIIQWNATPSISGSDSDLGEKTASFGVDYTVGDTDAADTITVVEKIDGTAVRTINNAVRGQTYTFDLTGNWSGLSLGSHTMTITATDNNGASATRTYTFTKKDDRIVVHLKNPPQTSVNAKEIVVSGVMTIPTGATLKVEVCNNAFDASPAWEDATQAYLNKAAHTFVNATKTAANWGVDVRLTILKNTAIEKAYIKAFGFNFGRSKG